MLVPYSTQVMITRWPVANIVFIGLCVLSFFGMVSGVLPESLVEALILDGWAPVGLLGHLFLHGDFWHLLFNMIYVSGFWLILLWFLLDAWGAFSGASTGIAYWDHLGGLFAGIGLGFLFEANGWARLQRYDNPSLPDMLFRKTREGTTRPNQDDGSGISIDYYER